MILVKEEFLTDDKTIRARRNGGDGVVTMWLALKGYAARKLTDGFIPDDAVDSLPGAPRRPRVLMKHLVECGIPRADGTRGAGLVDPVQHADPAFGVAGWQLHDYLDHANSADEEAARREHEKDRKALYRALKRLSGMVGESIESIRNRIGKEPALARVTGIIDDVLSRRVPRDRWWDVPGRIVGRATDVVPESPSRPHAPPAGAPPRAPQPSPAQPSPSEEPERDSLGARRDRFAESFETECPDGLVNSPDHLALCVARDLDPLDELAKFRAWAKSHRRRCLDWEADYELWLRRSKPVPPAQRRRTGPVQTEQDPAITGWENADVR